MSNDEIRKAMKAINANNLYMVRDLSKVPDSGIGDEKQNDVENNSSNATSNATPPEVNIEKLKWTPTDRVVPGTYVDIKDIEYNNSRIKKTHHNY